MDKREQMIRLWFSMWLEKKDLGMDDIFAENVIYTESYKRFLRFQKENHNFFDM